uniref:testis-specific serine/threonine-protein kinase 2-like n=1 Tax=Ciona intestinalis TaxID=7719 RepID=UPI0005218E62|nr:testis-specific serine/threonine-protein kinase 2-like [Ciona intestinalis]|eukprot:XP_002123558.3 testis-specific serine/threonine-protein kinase 2-like [Ciona intestinalis]
MQTSAECSERLTIRKPPKPIPCSETEMLRSKGYILRNTIGQGTYSKVKRACSIAMKRDIAIKIISRDDAPEVFRKKFLPREVEVLSILEHPSIVKVFEIFETKNPARLYIVTEYFHNGDLLDHVKSKGSMDEMVARPVIADVCRAGSYLHHNNISHRDIKCENILLHVVPGCKGAAYQAKLCDFGFARRFPTRTSKDHAQLGGQGWLSNTFCGSAAYASPEILERKLHNPMSADVWATGVVVFITVFGAMPFDDTDIRTMVKMQKRGDVTHHRSNKVSVIASELIGSILRPHPRHRPTMQGILRHRWFHADLTPGLQHQV